MHFGVHYTCPQKHLKSLDFEAKNAPGNLNFSGRTMPVATAPLPATDANAAQNNAWVATQIRDNNGACVIGRRRTNGRCRCCNRKPRRGELCCLMLDPSTNLTIEVGIGVCHHDFLRAELRRLVHAVNSGNHPQKVQRIQRMQAAIKALPRNLP
jgi:hypothetical protein